MLRRIWPEPFDLFLFVVLGIISAVGGLMMTLAYRDGPPSLAASFGYFALPMSIIWVRFYGKACPIFGLLSASR